MGLEQIVNLSISRQTAAISQAGFGTPFIHGVNKVAAGVGTYGSLTDVLAEPGITTGTDEYKAAVKLFAQSPRPSQIKIGKAISKVAQVDTITPIAANLHAYEVTISGRKNGVGFTANYTYTADGSATAAEIVAGLIALINADAGNGVTASGTTTLIITANVAGQPFTTSINADSDMSLVHTTANVGVADSLAALSLLDDDWYALIHTTRTIDDIMNAADYIESVFKMFVVSKSDAAMYDPASVTDIAYLLKAASYFRTAVMYSADTANYPEAGMLGLFLPKTPGTEQWSYKTFAGVVVDSLNGTQVNALKNKNCNFYYLLGGKNVSREGKVAGGEWIDVIRLIDLIRARQMEAIFGSLYRLDKIPFTNGGITVIENNVSGVLKAQQKIGGVAPDNVDADGNLIPGYSTSFPKITDVSTNDRANRTLTGGSWTAKISGAIVAGSISGTVTV